MAKNKYKPRKDGRYQANILLGHDEETGKKLFKTVYAKTSNELEYLVSDIKDKVNKGIYTDDKGITVGEWAVKWYEIDKASCGIRTKEMYELIVYKHIIKNIGNIRLRDLRRSDIQLMINKNSEHRRTCEQIKMSVKQMLDSAIEEGILYKNVAIKISLPTKQRTEKRSLNELEKKAIKNADFDLKEKAFIYILLYCGLRRGEILGLSQNDIDLKSKILSVNNVVTFDKGNPVLKTYPKSFAGIREIPIPDALVRVLQEYLKNTFFLFQMETRDSLMSKSSYDKFWNKIINKINISALSETNNQNLKVINGLTAHVFRHNYATMLYYNDIDIKDAQRLLGHSNIKITLDIYTHLDSKKSNAATKLNNLIAL